MYVFKHLYTVKAFLQYFAHKEYKNDEEKNEFFNSFIRRVILFDDKIIIVYNTGSDEEISIDNTELLDSINGGETLKTTNIFIKCIHAKLQIPFI